MLEALKRNDAISNQEIAGMLAIRLDRLHREAAFAVFTRYGCDSACVSAALRLLKGLWSGMQTQDEEFFSKLTSTPGAKDYALNAHREAESQAASLVQSNPCAALEEIMDQDSSIDDPVFSAAVEEKLHLREKCKSGHNLP